MKNLNDKIGIEYNTNLNINDKRFMNCNTFICSIDEYYNLFSEEFKNNFSWKNSEQIIKKYYDLVNFENRVKGDIIFIKDKGKKFYSHVAKLVNKFQYIHNTNTKYGSKIEDISMLKFLSKDFIILRKKEVIEK